VGGVLPTTKFPAKIHQNVSPVVNNEIVGARPGESNESGAGFDSHSTPQFYYLNPAYSESRQVIAKLE
jgi:hypothetical protein